MVVAVLMGTQAVILFGLPPRPVGTMKSVGQAPMLSSKDYLMGKNNVVENGKLRSSLSSTKICCIIWMG